MAENREDTVTGRGVDDFDRFYLLGCLATALSCDAKEGGSTIVELLETLKKKPYDYLDEFCLVCRIHMKFSCFARPKVSKKSYFFDFQSYY